MKAIVEHLLDYLTMVEDKVVSDILNMRKVPWIRGNGKHRTISLINHASKNDSGHCGS